MKRKYFIFKTEMYVSYSRTYLDSRKPKQWTPEIN